MAIKQTAGRDALGGFAPKFAQLNDDVLFGEVWSREGELSLRDRSVVTVVALMAQGLTDSSFKYHLTSAKNNGVTKAEIAEILTHAAFYAGWPKAWAAFRMAKEVWAADDAADARAQHQNEMVFPIGAPTTRSRSTSSGKATSRPFPPSRSASATWRSSPAAATTGTSITPKAAAGRSSSAWLAEGFTRNGESRHRSCTRATWSTSPRG